jgi:hypothetical protein
MHTYYDTVDSIDKVNARSFTCLCKIIFPNSSPKSEPKSGGGRAPVGEKVGCKFMFGIDVEVIVQHAF